jgi:RND superfamily putative drug exporter
VEIVVDRAAAEPSTQTALVRLRTQLASDPRFGAGSVIRSRDGTVAALAVPVRGDPSGDRAVAAVRDLRSHVIPRTFERTDAEVLVGGTTSENIDYFDSVVGPAPWVIALVLGLTLVFLTIVFRSLVVAATSVLLNLLSVGAAYGLLVLVFQDGVGAGVFGFDQVDTIEAWVPLFLFSVLFGLSMDYQVFLLSRIKERYDELRGQGRSDEADPTTQAVVFGVASTARIITGAALIIIAVFVGFAAGDQVEFQQMGFGIAVSLLIDATLVRLVLLPAVLTLLGERTWYLPRWLGWLPHVEIVGAAADAPGAPH